jgi:hypothetical protein
VAPFAGLDATTLTVASNSATIFSGLPSLYNHELPGVTANTVLADLRRRLSVINDAYVVTIAPPPVQVPRQRGRVQDDAGRPRRARLRSVGEGRPRARPLENGGVTPFVASDTRLHRNADRLVLAADERNCRGRLLLRRAASAGTASWRPTITGSFICPRKPSPNMPIAERAATTEFARIFHSRRRAAQ